jgi:alkaline phosphatase D
VTDQTPTERPFNFTRLWTQIEQEAMRGLISYMTRREFMKAMGAGAIVAAFGRLAQSMSPAAAQDGTESTQDAPGLPNGVASGDVAQDSAVLWAWMDVPGTVTFELRKDGTQVGSAQFEVVNTMQPAKVQFNGLTAGTTYTYEVRAQGQASGITGTFTTPASLGEKRGLRFGVSGDWRGELRPYVSLGNVTAQDLAFFVVLGDTIYADYPSEAVPAQQCVTLDDFRRKHAEVYTPQFGRNIWPQLRAAIPFYACIDDHEVTNDFAGAAAPETMPEFDDDPAEMINQTALYRNGLQAFAEYHPIADTVWENTGDPRFDGRPKLYRYRTFGSDAAMIMVDARSFRDAAIPDLPLLSIFDEAARREFLAKFWEPGRTMLGRPQVDALKADLLKAQADGLTWKFIMLPEPAQLTGWLGGFDRWEGYAPERTEVLQFIEDSGITNVVIIAADVHTTFITGLNYQTAPNGPLIPSSVLEITTGSVAFWPPTGQALVEGAAQFRLISGDDLATYRTGTIQEKDALLVEVYDRFVSDLQGYAPISLDGTNAELIEGSLIAGHSFGWTAFEIDADTQELTATTYGVRAYDLAALTGDLDEVLSRAPQVLSVVKVRPV